MDVVRATEAGRQRRNSTCPAEVLRPAVQLAEKGFPVSYYFDTQLNSDRELLARFPESLRVFGGLRYADLCIQPELAQTLKRISEQGAADFYEGETARRLVAAMEANGGLITLADLKAYKAMEREPLVGHYKGYEVITAPPPSSGGIGILQMLGMLEGSGYEKSGAGSAAQIHYVAEVMRRYYADRSEFLGDPDFVKNPVSQLLDPRYIATRRATIDLEHATSSEQVHAGPLLGKEGTETTHYNVIDSEGNAVEVTYTLNAGFGSGVTVPGLGFLLNDEMDDFAGKPGSPNLFGLIQGEMNAIQPGKRPLSSMTPTLLVKDGKPYLAVGAPGGSRIINGVLQVILNVVDFHMNVQEAVDWPRIHHQWMPDQLYLERGVSPDTVERLRAMGHKIASTDAAVPVVARTEAILVDGGWYQGAADGRGNAKAAGY